MSLRVKLVLENIMMIKGNNQKNYIKASLRNQQNKACSRNQQNKASSRNQQKISLLKTKFLSIGRSWRLIWINDNYLINRANN